jgi:NADH:ubiquinone oxidoreductase subunit F (NADH-binding)
MANVCGQCETCRAGMATKALAELERTCAHEAPKTTMVAKNFWQVSMGALGYANLTKKTGWTAEVRDSRGIYRRSAGGFNSKKSATEWAVAILRFED